MGGRGAVDSYYSHKNFAIYPLASGAASIAADLIANITALDTAPEWLSRLAANQGKIPDSAMFYIQSEVACNLIDTTSTNTIPLTVSTPSNLMFLTDLTKINVSAAAKIAIWW